MPDGHIHAVARTTAHGTEWPAPVEVEYVPAMHAVHAEDPAGPPRRMRVAVNAIHVAAATPSPSRHASCPPCRVSTSLD